MFLEWWSLWSFFQKVLSFRRFKALKDIWSRSISSYAFCMDAYTLFLPPPGWPCQSSLVNFVLMLRNLMQLHRAIYQAFIIQPHFFLRGLVGLRSLWKSWKIEIVKPQTLQNKSLCIFEEEVWEGGGAIWILSLSWRCNHDCKSSSLNVKCCRVDAILISHCLIRVIQN